MKSFVVAGLVVASAGSAFAQGQLTITSPPSLLTCLPAALTASGGTGPYTVRVLPGGQSAAAALADLGTTTGALTWNVNLAAGTSVTFEVRDTTGAVNYSSQVTIQAGSSTSCVGQAASISGTTAAASASSSVAASSASNVASAAASSASAIASSAASRASSAAGSASSAARSAASGAATASASSGSTGAATIIRPAAGALALVGAVAYLLL